MVGVRRIGWVFALFLMACDARGPADMREKALSEPPASSAAARTTGFGAAEATASPTYSFDGDQMEGAVRGPTPESPETEKMPQDKGSKAGRTGGGKASVMAAVATPVSGVVSDQDLRAAVDAKANEMSRCLNEDTVMDATLKIMPSGSVTEVTIARSMPDHPMVRDCVASILRAAKVQNVRGGEPTVVTVKLMLAPGGVR